MNGHSDDENRDPRAMRIEAPAEATLSWDEWVGELDDDEPVELPAPAAQLLAEVRRARGG